MRAKPMNGLRVSRLHSGDREASRITLGMADTFRFATKELALAVLEQLQTHGYTEGEHVEEPVGVNPVPTVWVWQIDMTGQPPAAISFVRGFVAGRNYKG
jgi:hypothetical protein